MGSKDRILRYKDKLRSDILCTAMDIMKSEGPSGVSIRKIAERIEYTAPIIYSYFENKQAILVALSNSGYELLNLEMDSICKAEVGPEERLAGLLVAVWNFANSHRPMFHLMYECGICSDDIADDFPGLIKFLDCIKRAIVQLKGESALCDSELQCKAYAAAALIHGLVAANIFWKTDAQSSIGMRDDMIGAFVKSLRER
ncbi:MAG TPA: TetR/AcrR family transcriptional regulator [Puia sp.]